MIKRMLKNERGLTLIELLAVVVILGIIAAIAVPAIGNIIENSKKDAHVSNAQMMLNSARLAFANESSTYEFTMEALVNNGYMDEAPKHPNDKGTASAAGSEPKYDITASKVEIDPTATSGAQYKITLKEESGRTIFNRVPLSEVTRANVPATN